MAKHTDQKMQRVWQKSEERRRIDRALLSHFVTDTMQRMLTMVKAGNSHIRHQLPPNVNE